MNQMLALSPFWVVALGQLLLMLSDAFGAQRVINAPQASPVANRATDLSLGTAIVMFAGACFAVAMGLAHPSAATELGSPQLMVDTYGYFMIALLCVLSALASLLGGAYLDEHRIQHTEFFLLLGWSTLGAMALVAAGDLLTLFVALETMSLGTYCMVGLRRTARSIEAALKYFLLGSFSSALLLFGAALLYGATGHTDYVNIGRAIQAVGDRTVNVPLLLSGGVLVLSGLLFKLAAVPFHAWTPDAYEGAPTPATAYMAAVVKAAAFGVLLRVLLVAFPDPRLMSWGSGWTGALALVAVLTMSFANLVAGRQSSVKRMLAYSSIAHAGYALIGVVALGGSAEAQSSVTLYVVTYAISTLGAFGCLIWAGSFNAEATTYADLAGLGKRHPVVAIAFSLFVVSLAGIPPTAGFFGKLSVFRAAMDAQLTGLVIIGMLNSVVAAYYYLRVLVAMYMREPAEGDVPVSALSSPLLGTAIFVAAVLVLVLGIFPETILNALAHASLTNPV
jgi:NADH-quinone oxidoreductase subunit N